MQSIIQNFFIDENILKEMILAIIFFSASIIFSINEKMNKEDQKKYIIAVYLAYLVYFSFLGINEYSINKDSIFMLLITITLNLICGINYGYNSDSLSKNLGKFELLIYKSIEWFFITKSYIFYAYIFCLIFVGNLCLILGFSFKLINYMIYAFFFIYHIISNMVDYMGVYSFEKISKLFFDTKIYFAKKLIEEERDIQGLCDILGFIVYVEDKDYFNRKGSFFNPYYIIKRKYNILKNKELSYSSHKEKSEKYLKLFWYRKILNRSLSKFIKILKNVKSYLRGFSTIEQQIIRVNIMYSDTYHKYIFRRKIFVEFFVNIAFFRAFIKRRKSVQNKKKLNYNDHKVGFLLLYYKEILKEPLNFESVIKKIENQSRLNSYIINIIKNEYDISHLKKEYTTIILEEIENINIWYTKKV